jgi:hypothetical protein|nr:MAG TPA: hypothetical protein [Caudoviricetes sp.]
MIQHKTPKKEKGARKKRRLRELEQEKVVLQDIQKYFNGRINAEIISILMSSFNLN